MRRSSPAFRSVTTPEQLDGLFDAAKASLGPLATYEGATGGSKLGASTSAGMTQSAAYVARAKYRNGEAFLDIQLVKVDGTWAVQGFKINSDLLMSYMTSRKS
jgi:hypothetical protein